MVFAEPRTTDGGLLMISTNVFVALFYFGCETQQPDNKSDLQCNINSSSAGSVIGGGTMLVQAEGGNAEHFRRFL